MLSGEMLTKKEIKTWLVVDLLVHQIASLCLAFLLYVVGHFPVGLCIATYLAGVLLDLDHLYPDVYRYIKETGDWQISLVRHLEWQIRSDPKKGILIFHTVEFLTLFGILVFFLPPLLPILAAMLIHCLWDFSFGTYVKTKVNGLPSRKWSLLLWIRRGWRL